jgi:hypothetical protein
MSSIAPGFSLGSMNAEDIQDFSPLFLNIKDV